METSVSREEAILQFLKAVDSTFSSTKNIMELTDGVALLSLLNAVDPVHFSKIGYNLDTTEDPESRCNNLARLLETMQRYCEFVLGLEITSRQIRVHSIVFEEDVGDMLCLASLGVAIIANSANGEKYIEKIMSLDKTVQKVLMEITLETVKQKEESLRISFGSRQIEELLQEKVQLIAKITELEELSATQIKVIQDLKKEVAQLRMSLFSTAERRDRTKEYEEKISQQLHKILTLEAAFSKAQKKLESIDTEHANAILHLKQEMKSREDFTLKESAWKLEIAERKIQKLQSENAELNKIINTSQTTEQALNVQIDKLNAENKALIEKAKKLSTLVFAERNQVKYSEGQVLALKKQLAVRDQELKKAIEWKQIWEKKAKEAEVQLLRQDSDHSSKAEALFSREKEENYKSNIQKLINELEDCKRSSRNEFQSKLAQMESELLEVKKSKKALEKTLLLEKFKTSSQRFQNPDFPTIEDSSLELSTQSLVEKYRKEAEECRQKMKAEKETAKRAIRELSSQLKKQEMRFASTMSEVQSVVERIATEKKLNQSSRSIPKLLLGDLSFSEAYSSPRELDGKRKSIKF